MATLPPNSYMPSVSLVILNGVCLLASKKEISTFQKVGMIASAAFQAFRPHFEETLNERWGKENVFRCCNVLPFVVMLFAVWKKEVSWKEWGRATAIWGAVHCLTGFLAQAIYHHPTQTRELDPKPCRGGDSNPCARPLVIRDLNPQESCSFLIRKPSQVDDDVLIQQLAEIGKKERKGYTGNSKGKVSSKKTICPEVSYKGHLLLCKDNPKRFLLFVDAYCKYKETWKKLYKYIRKDSNFSSVNDQLNAWILLFQEPLDGPGYPTKLTLEKFERRIHQLGSSEKEAVYKKMLIFIFSTRWGTADLLQYLMTISDLDRMIDSVCFAIEKANFNLYFQGYAEKIYKRCDKKGRLDGYDKILNALISANQEDLAKAVSAGRLK